MTEPDRAPAAGADPTEPSASPAHGAGLFTAGGVLGALAAASCCVLPLAFTLLGVSGAWMANLRALSPYKPYFVALSVLALGYGFYRVYGRARVACAEGQACAGALPGSLVKAGLWGGAVMVAVAASFPLWFPLTLPYLP